MNGHVLVIGYGNPLRGDDGIGQAVARALSADAAAPGAEVLCCHQLMPELAEQLAGAELAVFVDTAAGTPAGSVRIVPQRATALPASGFVHHLDPGALLLLAERLYGRAPEAFLVTVGAASLAIGEGLSPAAAESLPVAVAAVRRLIAEHLPENARWPAAPGSAP